MREEDVTKHTKYFSEGVRAHIWCYSDDSDWAVSIRRDEGHVTFRNIDSIKRAVFWLRRAAADPTHKRLALFEPQYDGQELEFASAEQASDCIQAIGQAVSYVQSKTKSTDWFDVPVDVFTPLTNNADTHAHASENHGHCAAAT